MRAPGRASCYCRRRFRAGVRGRAHGADIRKGDFPMVITAANLQPIVALLAGVLILIMPRLLNFIVAIYLIIVGLIGLGILKF
jgi:hypothetical protein